MGRTRVFYTSSEYMNDANNSQFASISICTDDDGPHLVFGSGADVILDLPIPPAESMAIGYALTRAARRSMEADEWDIRTERAIPGRVAWGSMLDDPSPEHHHAWAPAERPP